jgi:peroxiredoxin
VARCEVVATLWKLATICILLLTMSSAALGLEVGAPAPDFALTDLEGRAFQLSSLRGRVILLKLATTWCPSCGEQAEELQRAAPLLREHEVAVVEVFLQDSVAMVRNYLDSHRGAAASTVLIDDERVRRAYGVYLIPRTLVIDREFRVRRDGSLLSQAELAKLLATLSAVAK